MAITFPLKASPDSAAKHLKGVASRIKNLGPVLKPASEQVLKLMRDSFDLGRSPDGSAWAPNKESTVARKKSAKPGTDSGNLKASLYCTYQGNTLSFGSGAPYASAFQKGSTRSGTLKNTAYTPRREAGSAFTSITPGRAFLPFTANGLLMMSGPAKIVFTSINGLVMRYISTGKTQ